MKTSTISIAFLATTTLAVMASLPHPAHAYVVAAARPHAVLLHRGPAAPGWHRPCCAGGAAAAGLVVGATLGAAAARPVAPPPVVYAAPVYAPPPVVYAPPPVAYVPVPYGYARP